VPGKQAGMRTIVITGASSGVGRAAARTFGARGDQVALLARGEEALEGARREVAAAGGRSVAIPTDVADAAQVEAAAERTEAELGPIDVWVNDAMTSVFAPVWEVEPDEFRRATEVTYLGFVWGTMAALRRMRPRDRGTIVQVGSALAYRGIPLQAAYCGAKHAMEGFSESVRTELLHESSNVRLTMVQMPALNTPQFDTVRTRLPRHPRPVAPVYQPEVAAKAIVWASQHPRREIKVGASTAITVIGNKILPGVGDHYLARTGFDSQQTDQPVNGDRPDNLFAPLPGDRGAHGDFDDESKPRSVQLWLTTHKGTLAAAGAGAVGATAAVLVARARR
jgi:NAD(P)-dependent dehydrogenase (short-subunit alcohol dehydrogenase family)